MQEERRRLESLRDEIITASGLTRPEREALAELSTVDHTAEFATETFERERDLSILQHIEAEMHEVDDALQRLDAGTYGRCQACGRPIEPERLEANPMARYCKDDQAKAKQEHWRLHRHERQ